MWRRGTAGGGASGTVPPEAFDLVAPPARLAASSFVRRRTNTCLMATCCQARKIARKSARLKVQVQKSRSALNSALGTMRGGPRRNSLRGGRGGPPFGSVLGCSHQLVSESGSHMVDRYTIGRLSLYALYGGPATVFGHSGSLEELESDCLGRLAELPLSSGECECPPLETEKSSMWWSARRALG